MRQLILDAAAIKLAATKLSGSPIFAGPEGHLLAPGVIDVVDGNPPSGEPPWTPSNDLTRLLVAGAEACREINFQARAALEPSSRRRALKALTVPVCSLMDVVLPVTKRLDDKELIRHREASWSAHDKTTYLTVGRRFRKHRHQGPVRKVRNELGAHLDLNAFGPAAPKLQADDVLGAMGDALVLLMLSINHPAEAFSWVRCLGAIDADLDVVETMQSYPLTMRWVVDSRGVVRDVLPPRLAEDPRHLVRADVCSAIESYNQLVAAAAPKLPTITIAFQPGPAHVNDAAVIRPHDGQS